MDDEPVVAVGPAKPAEVEEPAGRMAEGGRGGQDDGGVLDEEGEEDMEEEEEEEEEGGEWEVNEDAAMFLLQDAADIERMERQLGDDAEAPPTLGELERRTAPISVFIKDDNGRDIHKASVLRESIGRGSGALSRLHRVMQTGIVPMYTRPTGSNDTTTTTSASNISIFDTFAVAMQVL